MGTSRITPESNTEDTLTVTQTFCKLMLQTSLIAIPAYLGLFMIAVPFDIDAGAKRGLILATPVIEFIVAAIIYSRCFLITLSDNERESADSLSRIKRKATYRKIRLILIGSIALLLGVFSGTILLLKAHL